MPNKQNKKKGRKIKAWAVIEGKELKYWWTGKNPNQILQYDIFYSKLDALQAQKEWGFPAKTTPCTIIIHPN